MAGSSSSSPSMGFDFDEKLHVLAVEAVDDGLIDRKAIERLLINSEYKGMFVHGVLVNLVISFLVSTHGFVGAKTADSDKTDLKVNLIITDYCMRGMTGYELLKRIKVHGGRSSRVLAKASSAIRRDKTECHIKKQNNPSQGGFAGEDEHAEKMSKGET
ncbi:two-component response regulator ARR17-like [Populus trichocarpa]|uniref:two-component response regulator ARR17-like n=1 Tax=Populus trichocarpa TaxID=3694 RepID=UPI0022790327|nr:two-component response regulator ARR17-like [Populus trichocarpa]